MIWFLLIWRWSWRVSRHCNKLAHEKKLPDAVETKNMCALIDCQAPEETQLQVKLLKAELQDQVPGTASRHGRGECHTVSLRRWSYTEVSFPPASSAKPRTWAIMSDFQRSMSDCIDSMYAVCRFFLKHVLLAEVCSGAICTSDKVWGRSWKRRYVGQAETKLKMACICTAGLHLQVGRAGSNWPLVSTGIQTVSSPCLHRWCSKSVLQAC